MPCPPVSGTKRIIIIDPRPSLQTQDDNCNGELDEAEGTADHAEVAELARWKAVIAAANAGSPCSPRPATYCARPSFASVQQDHLNDSTLAYRLKKPLADGRACLIFTPLESRWRGSRP